MGIEKPKTALAYDGQLDRRAPPVVRFLFFGFGVGFLVLYCADIRSIISADIENFPMAFRESAALTLLFTCVKVLAYLLFPYVAATWVYVPIRDFLATRVEGELLSVESIPAGRGVTWWASVPLLGWLMSWGMPVPGRSKMKVIRIGGREVRVPDRPELNRVLAGGELVGKQVVFTLGAFNRVLSIEVVGLSDGMS
jgi:hypothetical protein